MIGTTRRTRALAVTATAGVLGALALGGAVAAPAPADPSPRAGVTVRISVSSTGKQADNMSRSPSVSAHGRYVAFQSHARNLVAGDRNRTWDVFVRDRMTETTEMVSIDPAGVEGNDISGDPAISADGRHVAFRSIASNLVADDTNNRVDVFVRDLVAGATQRISVGPNGGQASGNSIDPAISADGRHVAFRSYASNLVADDTNNRADVFVRDLVAGTTRRVSVGPGGRHGNGNSVDPAISADGRYVTFTSPASNLVADDTNNRADVFVRDLETGTTKRVSIGRDDRQANRASGDQAISANGRFVAFHSYATNLVANDTNDDFDIFLRDRAAGTTRRVSVGHSGRQSNGRSLFPAISANGRYVVFASHATNLVDGDTNHLLDTFVRDRAAGTTRRASVGVNGRQANNASYGTAISADGRHVALDSFASNLVAGDTNGMRDVFVRTRPLQ